MLKVRRTSFCALTGSLAILVEGAGGWTITFDDADAANAVVETPDLAARCVAAFSPGAFVALLEHGIAASPAPVVIGDAAMLTQLGHVLAGPAKGGLAVRLITTSRSPRR